MLGYCLRSRLNGLKFYLIVRYPFSCFSYWNWPFLSFHILAYKSIFHLLSYGNTYWVFLPFFICSIVPWTPVPNFLGWSSLPSFPFLGQLCSIFRSLILVLDVWKSVLWKQQFRLQVIWLPIQRLRTICFIAIDNCKDWLIFWSIVLLIFQFMEILKWLIFHLETTCFQPCWRIWKRQSVISSWSISSLMKESCGERF